MKILIVVNSDKYSMDAVREGARMAANTWADVTLLVTQDIKNNELSISLKDTVADYLQMFSGSDSPYGKISKKAFREKASGTWECETTGGKKLLKAVIHSRRSLDADIIATARETGTDFLIIGAAAQDQPQWGGDVHLPSKIAAEADCSVLVVKESQEPRTVVACLDHDQISQESLEIINQLVTLHNAELKVVGIAGTKGLDDEVQKKMNEVVRYYNERSIRALVKMVPGEELENFVGQSAESGLIGIWYGKKSLFRKIFFKDRIKQLVDNAPQAALVLK